MFEVRTVGSDDAPGYLARFSYSNHLGSAALELDSAAQIISYEEYHPYGTTSYQAMNASINAIAKRYRYTGKERDEESGLYYHGARYYACWLARWTAVDPLEVEYAGWSAYQYCTCNPVMNTDSTGMANDGEITDDRKKDVKPLLQTTTTTPPTLSSPVTKKIEEFTEKNKSSADNGDVIKGSVMTAAFGTLVTSELIAAIAPVVAEIAIAVAIAIIILIVAKNIIERVLPRDTSGAETDTGTETEEGTDKDQGTKPRPGPYGPNGDKRLPGEGDGGGKGIKDVTNQPTKQPGEVTNPQPQPDPTKPPTPPAPPPDEPDDNSNAIYRSMQTENGNWIHSSPVGATNGRQLGARTPESIGKPDDNTAGDIQPVNGMVGPGITQTGLNGEYHGLSTSKHLTSMITKLESGEYKNKEGAVGMLDLRTLPPGLKAVQDSPGGHVTIYPSEVMTIEEYINKLNSLQWIPVYRKNK